MIAKEKTAALTDIEGGVITVPDAAEFLSVSKPSIYKMVSDGKLRAVKICGSQRILRRDVLDLVKTQLS